MRVMSTKRYAPGLLLALVALALGAGCSFESVNQWMAEGYPKSTLIVKSSDMGPEIMNLYHWFTGISVTIFILVEALLIYAVLRFRKKGNENGEPEQVHGNTTVELAWTIGPALIVLFIAVQSIRAIFVLAEPPAPPDIKIRVTGKQWWWKFDYIEGLDSEGIVTANELHLPVGKRAYFEIESSDVIHSFWLPNMGGKRDATPGHTNRMYFTPISTGTFLGQCAEFCGTAHALMKMTLVVQTEEEFRRWVEQQKATPAAVMADNMAAARDAFMANCAACHRVQGVSEFGSLGPDLTHVGSRSMFGAGLFPMDTDHLHRWLKNPQAMKPGAKMVLPQPLDDATITTLTAFLQSLK